MLAVMLFGMLMAGISICMILKPEAWGRALLRFTNMRFMHPFEIVTRLGFGISFVTLADQTKFPTFITVFGFILVAVGLGLLVTPPSYHRRFGVWCAERFSPYSRIAGLGSFAFGMFLIYTAI